jgi:hypothetical protein
MNDSIIDKLKKNIRKRVRITATTGENLVVIIRTVDEEDGVVYDLIETDQPQRYAKMGMPVPGTYLTPFEFIAGVDELETPDSKVQS